MAPPLRRTSQRTTPTQRGTTTTKSDAESPKNMKSAAATKRTLPMTVGSRQGHTGETPDTGIDCQQLCAPVYR